MFLFVLPQAPQLHTHLAFDNFDKFVETSSGKNTLHDTVGIVYQNKTEENIMVERNRTKPNVVLEDFATVDNSTLATESSRRRRKYVSSFGLVEPYVKSHQEAKCLVAQKPTVPPNLQNAHYTDYLWMIHHALNGESAKRWFAFNSERIIDPNPIQKISYLPNINQSPTDDSVVRKTLDMAKTIASECNQKHIAVTYDLAIASKAIKIQADLSPVYDHIFVLLGAFHIQISYFKVHV